MAELLTRELGIGWRVEGMTDSVVVLVKGWAVNHLLHLVLTVMTMGLWVFVWWPQYRLSRRRVLLVKVDAAGTVERSEIDVQDL